MKVEQNKEFGSLEYVYLLDPGRPGVKVTSENTMREYFPIMISLEKQLAPNAIRSERRLDSRLLSWNIFKSS